MLLDRRARFFIKLELTASPKRGVGRELQLVTDGDELDILTVLEEGIANGAASNNVRDGDVVRLTHAVQHVDGLAVLMFRRRDANASVQFFEHAQTMAVRRSDKRANEDPAVSAHLFIDLRRRNRNGSYRALIEEVPGLSISYIKPLLNSMLRQRPYLVADRRGVEVEATTKIELQGLPSQTIGEALEGGGIEFIELVRPPQLDGLDTAGLTPNAERLRLGVRRGDRRNPMDVIRRVRGFADAKGWNDMRVQVVTSDDRRRLVQLTRGADAATIMFVQSELVNTREDLPSCSSAVNAELVAHASRMFAAEGGWG